LPDLAFFPGGSSSSRNTGSSGPAVSLMAQAVIGEGKKGAIGDRYVSSK
jgi:hypothetical protein